MNNQDHINLSKMISQYGLSAVLVAISEDCQSRAKKLRKQGCDEKTDLNDIAAAWEDSAGAIDVVAQLNPHVLAVSKLDSLILTGR